MIVMIETLEGGDMFSTDKTNWSIHVEWIVLMATLIGGMYVIDAKIERQAQRTDRLYEMFIELVKERK